MIAKDKKQASRLGGLATVARHGREYMREIGRRGAAVTWSRYRLAPVGTSDLALVNRQTGEVKALISGGLRP